MASVDLSVLPAASEAKWRLGVHLGDAAEAIGRAGLPVERCSVDWGGATAHWLSPTQWLITSPTSSGPQVPARCQEQLGELLYSVTEVSDALTSLVVAGAGARRLLAMGSCIDFEQTSFGAGSCGRTKLAQVVVLIRVIEKRRFIVDVDRSLEEYLLKWFQRSLRDPLFAQIRDARE